MPRRIPLSLTITASGNKAFIKLIGDIYDWRNSASAFDDQVNALIEKGIKDVDLYIFTNGGDSIEANEIANIIARFPGEIHATGGAMVASAGSYIVVKCKSFKMPANGMLMIHKPELSATGNEDNITSGVELLKGITSDYRKAYATKTGMTEDEIEALWKNECYMTARIARDRKFCDGIIEEEVVAPEVAEQIITSWNRSTIPTALFAWAKNLTKPTNPTSNMKKIAAALKKDENSSEDALAQYAGELLTKNAELTLRLEALESKDKAAKKTEATEMIEAAVKDGRLEDSAKDHWQNMFETNHDSAKGAIMALKVRTKVADLLNAQGTTVTDKILAMSWDELDKAGKLPEIKAKHVDVYKAKFTEKFGREPKL